MAGNFAALWPTDPKFSVLKDLNPFKTVSKVQEASIILRVGFALSKWPHFNSIYLVRVPFLTGIAVCKYTKLAHIWFSPGFIYNVSMYLCTKMSDT